MSSNTACLIRESRFYKTKFPFFHLDHVSNYDVEDLNLQNDLIDISRVVYNDRIFFNFVNRFSPHQDDLDMADENDSDDDSDIDWYPPLIYL